MSNKSKAMAFADDIWDITVTGRNVAITDAMKQYAIDKISKIERFSHRIISAVVTMDIQRYEQRVDIVIKVDHIKIKSQASTDNMYASVDKAIDRIMEQLRRYKTKIRDHQAKGVREIDMNVNVVRPASMSDINEVNEDIEEETQRRLVEMYRPHKIVSKEKASLKELTFDEAIMKMDLSGDAFLVFRSVDDQMKLRVIYRRNDGNFAIIEAE